MDKTALLIKGLITLALAAGIVVYLMWRSLKRSDAPLRLISKWIMTGIVLYGLITQAVPLILTPSPVAALAVPLAAIYGMVLALIWTPSIVDYFSKRFEALYTGGEEPPEPKPVYSGALAKRVNGQPREAIYLIYEQLEKFPEDFAGQMLIADIQAQDMKDLAAAEALVMRVCAQPQHPPAAKAFALNSLADWYLSTAKSADDARRVLEKIQELLPDTEHSLQAAQRLAHLATQEQLLEPQERKPIKVPQGRRDLGLRRVDPAELIKTKSPQEELDELLAQLEQHPLDLDARERVARLYAEDFQRLDLAVQQLEEMVNCPNVSPKQVAHWLTVEADYYLRFGNDRAAATAALQRIVDLYPASAYSGQAKDRLIALAGEAQEQREHQPIKLGEYEQYVGLRNKGKG